MKRLLAIAACLFTLVSCTNPCLKLAQQVCGCLPTSNERDTCKTQASNENSRLNLTNAEESTCNGLLDKCSCAALDTPEGKQACGLARPAVR